MIENELSEGIGLTLVSQCLTETAEKFYQTQIAHFKEIYVRNIMPHQPHSDEFDKRLHLSGQRHTFYYKDCKAIISIMTITDAIRFIQIYGGLIWDALVLFLHQSIKQIEFQRYFQLLRELRPDFKNISSNFYVPVMLEELHQDHCGQRVQFGAKGGPASITAAVNSMEVMTLSAVELFTSMHFMNTSVYWEVLRKVTNDIAASLYRKFSLDRIESVCNELEAVEQIDNFINGLNGEFVALQVALYEVALNYMRIATTNLSQSVQINGQYALSVKGLELLPNNEMPNASLIYKRMPFIDCRLKSGTGDHVTAFSSSTMVDIGLVIDGRVEEKHHMPLGQLEHYLFKLNEKIIRETVDKYKDEHKTHAIMEDLIKKFVNDSNRMFTELDNLQFETIEQCIEEMVIAINYLLNWDSLMYAILVELQNVSVIICTHFCSARTRQLKLM